MRRLWYWPFSPFLLGIYPVIYIYSLNLGRVDPFSVITTLGIAVAAAAVLNVFCMFCVHNWQVESLALDETLIMHEWRKAALITDLIFILSYLWTCIVDLEIPWIYSSSWSKPVALLIMILIAAVCWVVGSFLRHARNVAYWTTIGNVCSVILLFLPLSQVLWYHMTNAQHSFGYSASHTLSSGHERPDIYYIILDGYARGDILADDMGYDNNAFLSFLKKKGFYVADQSRSNYAYTYLSLASSLNMDYINDLDGDDHQYEECLSRITKNKVTLLFKASGYRILQYAPAWFGPQETSMSEEAQEAHTLDEFQFLILRKTLLRGFLTRDVMNLFKERTLYTLNLLSTLPLSKRPTFIYAHLLCPHPPYVFDRSGNTPEPRVYLHRPAGSRDWYPKDRYTDQINYLNHRMEEVIDHLLRDSNHPPLIIIQGDHGAACDGTSAHPTPLMTRERMSILNAYYVPPELKARLYPSITPVNTFRLISNFLFRAKFPLLPDQSYYSGPMDATPYHFIDVKTLLPEKNNG